MPIMKMKKPFSIRVLSIRTHKANAINNGIIIAGLIASVSEAANVAPLGCVAKIVQKMLETVKAIDEIDEKRLTLLRNAVDYLILLEKHIERHGSAMTLTVEEEMNEFSRILQETEEKMRSTKRKSFLKRAFTKAKDLAKADLDGQSMKLKSAFDKLMCTLNLETNAAVQAVHTLQKRLALCHVFFLTPP